MVSEMGALEANDTAAAAPEPAAAAEEPVEPEPTMLVVSAADTYARVNHNLNQLWKANRARFVAKELEEEAQEAAEHQAEQEAAAAEAAAAAQAEQAKKAEAAKRAAE